MYIVLPTCNVKLFQMTPIDNVQLILPMSSSRAAASRSTCRSVLHSSKSVSHCPSSTIHSSFSAILTSRSFLHTFKSVLSFTTDDIIMAGTKVAKTNGFNILYSVGHLSVNSTVALHLQKLLIFMSFLYLR